MFAPGEGRGAAVMIGDSVPDLQTARAAGVPCVLMTYGYTPVPAGELGADRSAGKFLPVTGGAAAAGRLIAGGCGHLPCRA